MVMLLFVSSMAAATGEKRADSVSNSSCAVNHPEGHLQSEELIWRKGLFCW